MKYLLFTTLTIAQLWLSSFEVKLNEQAQTKFNQPPYYTHLVSPVDLATDAEYLAAVPILEKYQSYLTDEERAGLVDDIASYLPEIGGTP